MKLVKGGEHQKKCKQITKSGKRCSRSAVESGYCRQHYKKAKEQGKIMNLSGNKALEEIPDPPVALEERGRHSWNIYCSQMIQEGRLYQSYVYALADLCDLEDQLAEARQDMREKGYVNTYDTAIQRNGYASHYDKILQHIRNLRADYGLTEAHRKDQPVKKQSADNEEKQTDNRKKVTGYQGN